MKILIVGLLALLLGGCGEEVIVHDYIFLCRTEIQVKSDAGPAGYLPVYCQPDWECIERVRRAGQAETLRADGYALGCPGPGEK